MAIVCCHVYEQSIMFSYVAPLSHFSADFVWIISKSLPSDLILFTNKY